MTDQASRLQERYGRTPERAQRDRRMLWVFGGAVALVFVAWVVWAGLLSPGAEIDSRTTGYSVDESANEVEVRWQLTVEPGTPVQCAVQALSESKNIVGWKIVDIPASDRHVRAFSETVRVMQPATTGLIHHCWSQ
ncbi:DUF4307 domain-containing protein [Ruicaihuangia caeni]|uniref:DUF4307 domain-containing protein n=1 Tax=Ruicaihuangia caeni TaxID=3042517 RepID=A0AAW6T6P8_9MICO|nr:DUF4307 domain-containing protein [Klugiella sp. YN-L-19]MDI2099501.1 DUF4307 domain-containing protein [Klugiella sp. YN-L-19]